MFEAPRFEWKGLEWRDKVRFACVACFGFMLVATVLSASRASMLMWFTSSRADGVITREAESKNHNYVSYEYNVGGKTYSGTGYGPDHEDMQKGQTVEVYFFTPLPSESVIVGKDEQRGYVAFGMASGLLMGVFAGFGDAWNRQRSRSRSL
jgi:hypothetical protein